MSSRPQHPLRCAASVPEPSEIPDDFLRRVKTAQIWGGVTKTGLANEMAVTEKTVYSHLRKKDKAAQHVPTIAQACGVPDLFLLGYTNHLSESPELDAMRAEVMEKESAVGEALSRLEAAREAILQIRP